MAPLIFLFASIVSCYFEELVKKSKNIQCYNIIDNNHIVFWLNLWLLNIYKITNISYNTVSILYPLNCK